MPTANSCITVFVFATFDAGIDTPPAWSRRHRSHVTASSRATISGPVGGTRLNLTAGFTRDMTGGRSDVGTLLGEIRHYRQPLPGVVNVGLLFALSEFVVAWVIAFVYSKKANAQFDAMAQEIINDVNSGRI